MLLVTLPWLNPFANGPSAAAVPLLVTWVAATLLALPRLTLHHQAVVQAWLMASLLSCVFALFQYFGASEWLAPWVNYAESGTAFANLRQRNQFATLTNIGQAALLALCLGPMRLPRRPPRGSAVLLILLCTALLSAGTAASTSRTGLTQLALLILMALSWQLRAPAPSVQLNTAHRNIAFLWAGTAITSYFLAAWSLPLLAGLDPAEHGIFARLTQDLGCSSRKVLWANVIELIAERPWFGWGWGELDYAHYIHLYADPSPERRFCAILDNAHNLPLHLAVELGLPFAAMVCFGIAWWLVRQRPWAEQGPMRQLAWSVLALIGLHSLLEFPLWYGPFQMAVGLCLWLLWQPREGAGTSAIPAISPNPNPMQKPANTPTWRARAATGFVALTLLSLGYAAWDYWRISQIYLAPPERSPAYRDDTLRKLQSSVLFKDQVRFAELSLTAVNAGNAAQVYALAGDMLHFSPEPKVIEKLIEAATLLGQDAQARYHLARLKAAFPADYDAWRERNHAEPAR